MGEYVIDWDKVEWKKVEDKMWKAEESGEKLIGRVVDVVDNENYGKSWIVERKDGSRRSICCISSLREDFHPCFDSFRSASSDNSCFADSLPANFVTIRLLHNLLLFLYLLYICVSDVWIHFAECMLHY